MEDFENEEELEWPFERRNKIGVIKGFKHRKEKRLPATSHVTLKDDMLTENVGKDWSGEEIADMLCNMSHVKLLEAIAPAVVEIPASSSG